LIAADQFVQITFPTFDVIDVLLRLPVQIVQMDPLVVDDVTDMVDIVYDVFHNGHAMVLTPIDVLLLILPPAMAAIRLPLVE
jgi:hypothetical protein